MKYVRLTLTLLMFLVLLNSSFLFAQDVEYYSNTNYNNYSYNYDNTSNTSNNYSNGWYDTQVYTVADTLNNEVTYTFYPENSDSLNSVNISDTLYVKSNSVTFIDDSLKGEPIRNYYITIKDNELYGGVTFEDRKRNVYVTTHFSNTDKPKMYYYKNYNSPQDTFNSYNLIKSDAQYYYRYGDIPSWKELNEFK